MSGWEGGRGGGGGTLAGGVKEKDSMGFSLYGEFLDLHHISSH